MHEWDENITGEKWLLDLYLDKKILEREFLSNKITV